MASSRNRMDRRDRKARRRRYGMRVNDSARKLAMIRAARLRPGAPDSAHRLWAIGPAGPTATHRVPTIGVWSC
jgi:hypothetical protein